MNIVSVVGARRDTIPCLQVNRLKVSEISHTIHSFCLGKSKRNN